MKNTSIISALLFFSALSTLAVAQAQNDSTKSVYNESVIVVGDYNPVLDGVTEKVNVAPSPNDNVSDDLKPQFNYSITPRRISSVSATSGIKAAKVIGSPTRLYNNYIRLGLGHDFASFLDFNPLLDAYYMSTRKDDYAYGARLFHQTDVTTFGKADDNTSSPDHYGRDKHSETAFDIFGKYILKKEHLFTADLSFDREKGRYYGFSDSVLFDKMALTRDDISFSDYTFAYNNISLNLGASSLNTDVNKLGYQADLSLADMWSRYDASQLSMTLSGGVHYGFPMFSKYKAIAYLNTKWIGFKQRYDTPQTVADLPLGYDTSASLPDTNRVGRHLWTINPYVDFLFNGFKIHAGLALGFNSYDAPDNTTLNLFPDLAVTKSFSNNSMSLTVGFVGDYLPNDWNAIRLINLYILPAPYTVATVDNDFYARFRINFSKKLMLNLSAENHFLKNAMYFSPAREYQLANLFKPYFCDNDELNLAANLTFVNDEMITLSLGCDYSVNYNVPQEVVLLYSPDFTAHLDADINYKDKWLFSLKTLFVAGMDADFAINPTTLANEVSATLPAHFGISLGAEYLHSRALSFFAKIDNMAFKRYFIWANYPVQRFNAMLGLTYTIPNQ